MGKGASAPGRISTRQCHRSRRKLSADSIETKRHLDAVVEIHGNSKREVCYDSSCFVLVEEEFLKFFI